MQLHILHHAARGAIHGAWMSKELARHGYKISPDALYPRLHKMQKEGQLRSYAEVVGGRSRRSYVATARRRRELQATIVQLRELAYEVLGDDTT